LAIWLKRALPEETKQSVLSVSTTPSAMSAIMSTQQAKSTKVGTAPDTVFSHRWWRKSITRISHREKRNCP
jgi:hypothetical protein